MHELLTVLVVLLVLGSMLVPALARVDSDSRSITCLTNLKRLTLAWTAYSNDYNDVLPLNNHGGVTRAGTDRSCWITGWLDWSYSNADNTNTNLLCDERWAKLAPYFGRDPRLFKCPADPSSITTAGQRLPRVRSIAMDGAVGDGNSKTTFYSDTFYVVTKMTGFLTPPPAQAWVLWDEHPDSINDACSFNNPLYLPGQYLWTDLPASYHDGGCGFSFADSHCEIKRWTVPGTLRPITGTDYTFPNNSPNSADYAWLSARIPRKPQQ